MPRSARDDSAPHIIALAERRLVVAEGSRHLITKERPETIVEAVASLIPAAH